MAEAPGRRTVAAFSGGGTGGHLYPALALAEALERLRPDVEPFFVGARHGLEARVLPERGLNHLLLPVAGLRRGQILRNLLVLWALVRSVVQTGIHFAHLRPGVVVATGGYACGPAGLVALLMGIPLALQEQNAEPGFTTRILSRWARQVHLAFPEARVLLPSGARARAILSGNPVRTVTRFDPGDAREAFGLDPVSRVVLVVGGSQGARAINTALLEAIQAVQEGDLEHPADLVLLWSTGPTNLSEVQNRLSELGSPRWVRVLGYIQDMPRALSGATLAISRAGAMTTSELLAWGVPAILIPLPTAAADHQSRNAQSLQRAGAAVHLPEKELRGRTLWERVSFLMSRPRSLESMRQAALSSARPEATVEIARALASLLPLQGNRPLGSPAGGGA